MLIQINTCIRCEDRTELLINGESVLDGDNYHHKIDSQIEGFIKALDFLKVEHTISRTKNLPCEYFCDE